MNGLLYRAVACVRGKDAPEVHVFFEAPPLTDPGYDLLHMLSAVWFAPADTIHVENIVEEYQYLSRCAVGDKGTGDARLFEIGVGDGGRIHYCDPSRTLLLVSPATLARLTIGLQAAQELSGAGFTTGDEPDWRPTEQRVVQRDETIEFQGLRLDVSGLGFLPGERVCVLIDDDHGHRQVKVRQLVGGVPRYATLRLDQAVVA